MGILIIDEVFDYLDGSNLLAVQYYLSQLIDSCKLSRKVLFPIILTHLDPEVFANYYFNKRKVHYISSYAKMDVESPIVKMLRLREDRSLNNVEKEEIEKYYIHYIDREFSLSTLLVTRISTGFCDSNIDFRKKCITK